MADSMSNVSIDGGADAGTIDTGADTGAQTTQQTEPTLREQIESARTEIAERTRDEAGRFAKTEADAKGRQEPASARKSPLAPEALTTAEKTPTAAIKPAAEPTEGQQTQPERPTLAPNAWSAAAKAAWVNADPILKAEIARREGDIHKEFTRQDAERNLGLQFRKAAEPYAQLIQAEGGNPIKGFQNYLETARILRTGDPQTKVQLVRQMCQQFGIDLGQTQNADPNANPQNRETRAAIDPNVQHLYTELNQLKSAWQSQQVNAQNREQTELQGAIQAFASDPKHEHFEAVKPAMAALLQSGQAQSLEEAYEAALWMRPDIRSSLIANQTAELQAKRVADAKAKADAAKRAGGSISGSPGNGFRSDPAASDRSLRQELEANFASHRV